MCMNGHDRHPLFCIVPPHVLRAIAQNGAPAQRTQALRTLALDSTTRALRAVRLAAPVLRVHAVGAVRRGQKNRTIHDARKSWELPGVVVRTEGASPTGDPASDEAYDGLGNTYDYYWQIHKRDSIDDSGLPLKGVVHFGQEYNNAFWDGQQMVFGDGDGVFFNRFTIALDIIGHELTHGVTEYEAQLIYDSQSGALNESVSDVFGSLIKQRVLNQRADEADWLIGAGLFMSGVQGVALRSMKAPGTAFDDPILGKDPQPDHMSRYNPTPADHHGVHINSGIPNKSFYIVAVQLGGYAWEKAARIWYETLRDNRLYPNATFDQFAALTVDNAGRIYGPASTEQQATRTGWQEVGVSTG